MDARADGVRVAHPLFQAGGGGSSPTSALQLVFVPLGLRRAMELNRLWHSRLPHFEPRTQRRDRCLCYGAECGGRYYAAAIWTNPVARLLSADACLELRRFAVAPDAPKNTASRMLGWMARDVARRLPAVARLVSYQDADVHAGTIYRAAGWVANVLPTRSARGHWCHSGRKDGTRRALALLNKVRWEKVLRATPAAPPRKNPAPPPAPGLFDVPVLEG